MKRRAFIAGTGTGLTGVLAGCVTGTPLSPDVSETETRTYEVDDGTELAVHNENGSVTVAGHDGDELEVEISRSGRTQESLDAVTVAVEEADGAFTLRTDYDDSVDARRASVSLTVQCPDGVSVDRLETSDGSVEAADVPGDATLETSNGSITARRIDGAVALRTSNGSIEAREVGALREATTENAGVDVDVPALVDDAVIRTENSGIEAALAPDLDAEVTAETTNGSVDVEGVEFSSVETSGTRVSGTLGDGTHELSIETENDDIDLTALSE